MTTAIKPKVVLPDWAFRALAAHSFDALYERTEHELIIITRRNRPELVLIDYQDWQALVAAYEKRGGIEHLPVKDSGG